MEGSRFKTAYLVLLPALLVAACVLGYYTYLTAAQFERLGEKSIADSGLILVRDRISRVEQQIIKADHAVIRSVDVEYPARLAKTWKPLAEDISPSVRAVAVLDGAENIVGYAARASTGDQRAFRSLFKAKIVPDLELASLQTGRLKHLHASYDGSNYLISYQAQERRGRRFYIAMHHDTGFLVRNVFPELLKSEGQQWHNVVDRDNRNVFGPSLAEAGDYVVGMRFPTTLYRWRMQIAPKAAPLLEEKGRTSRFNQVALIGLSFGIILIAVVFIILAADKERRLAGLKSEFIANVSHELKTPLSVIRMFSEMLLTKRVRDERKQQQYLGIICSETERLTGLIENVLDFAAVERGKRRYELNNIDLADVVTRAIETFRYRFEREGAEVHFRQGGPPAHADVDEQAVLLAVINLLDNAVKYGQGTPVEVSLDTDNVDVRVTVRDRGEGIPESNLKRIFERFYRSETNAKTRGSGIGLALVKQIAEEHRGRAWAENAPDGGAIVSFTIPRKDPTVSTITPSDGERGEIDTAQPVDIVARHG